jgi:hypothetical protein
MVRNSPSSTTLVDEPAIVAHLDAYLRVPLPNRLPVVGEHDRAVLRPQPDPVIGPASTRSRNDSRSSP